MPIWHADIIVFIRCRTNKVATTDRVQHLFPALWIPDYLCVVSHISIRQRLTLHEAWLS